MSHSFSINWVNSVDSTNAKAKNDYNSGLLKSGYVIVADTQTGGRGQMRTKWHDEAGKNLLLTLVIEPQRLLAIDFFRLNQAISLAICDALEKDCEPKIKWPNDILVDERKIAGILIETSIQRDFIKTAFIGVGLNVNQENFDFDFKATSLRNEIDKEIDRQLLLDKLLEAIEFRLQQMQIPVVLNSNYLLRLLGINQYYSYRDKDGEFLAKVVRVESDGRLMLQVKNSHNYRYYRFKEVQLVG